MSTATPPKSCLTCPSFMDAATSVQRFGKSTGAAVCAEYGIPLGKPDLKPAQTDKLARHFAKDCQHYGQQPTPGSPAERRFLVVLPDMDARTADASVDDKTRCTSCAMCRNFVRDDVVATELGWTTGLCAAKGKLILPNRQTYEARDCDFRRFGTIRSTTAGLHLLPEYEDAFNLSVDPVNAYFKNKGKFVDPQEYPTDKPVSTAEEAAGIRAWREIKDPEGSGNVVYLPIYRREYLTDEQWVKVPQAGDDEHPELYVDHNGAVYRVSVCWRELDETPALWGPAGVGKTELFRHVAWLMQLPFERFSITASTELDDLAGKMRYSPEKGTYFQYGRLPIAWQSPSVVCLDEPNTGPPDVWQFLRPLTDNSKQLVLDQNSGERIARHSDCYLGMAMNPAWDPRNIGATSIADADARRLLHLFMELPPAKLEREIIKSRVLLDGWEIDTDRLDTVMAISVELRGLCKDGTLPITWGVSQQIKVSRAMRWFEPVTAYRMAAADYLEPEAQDVLLDVVRAHVESK